MQQQLENIASRSTGNDSEINTFGIDNEIQDVMNRYATESDLQKNKTLCTAAFVTVLS